MSKDEKWALLEDSGPDERPKAVDVLTAWLERRGFKLNKLAARAQARVKAGQPLATALDEVFATYRAAVEQLIARAATETEAES
jgi:hypothetical protein